MREIKGCIGLEAGDHGIVNNRAKNLEVGKEVNLERRGQLVWAGWLES